MPGQAHKKWLAISLSICASFGAASAAPHPNNATNACKPYSSGLPPSEPGEVLGEGKAKQTPYYPMLVGIQFRSQSGLSQLCEAVSCGTSTVHDASVELPEPSVTLNTMV